MLNVYDIETYPNCFTLTALWKEMQMWVQFEISDYRDDRRALFSFLEIAANQKHTMVGFNNVGFDYPVIHYFIKTGGAATADMLYDKAVAIINAEDRWEHIVYPKDRYIPQLDLYLVNHFDNKARATGLKKLEIAMGMDNVQELPFPVGERLNPEQIKVLIAYNKHDVVATDLFLDKSMPMINFRSEITQKYGRDFMNHNDTKIGKDYFQMKLEEAGVTLYEYGPHGRRPMQTPRPAIILKECLLLVEYTHHEFTRVYDWLNDQIISDTKGVFKDLNCVVRGFQFDFGTGGIHGSIESEAVHSDDEYVVIDLDVTSYYPSLAIANRWYPEHLGESFCDIYQWLKEQRVGYAKGTAENAMLKLALNGVYGDSNNKFSVFYDPMFTMRITLNGQLLLCKLADMLFDIEELQLIQVNTDGLTVRVPRARDEQVMNIAAQWEHLTGLQLERADYQSMYVRDVNNYLAVYEGGGVKRKGAYEWDVGWHQNHSSKVVQKITERVLLHGGNIRDELEQHDKISDFFITVSAPRSSKLVMVDNGEDRQIQNISRMVVTNDGMEVVKIMPPTPKKVLEGDLTPRRIGQKRGWLLTPANDLSVNNKFDINYEYYAQEIEKLCLGLR